MAWKNLSVRLGLSMILSEALVDYAFWVAISGMREIEHIFRTDQVLAENYQNIFSSALLEEMALQNILLDPEDRTAAKNLDKFRRRTMDLIDRSESLIARRRPGNPEGRRSRLARLATALHGHFATMDQILKLAGTDRSRATALLGHEETEQWRGGSGDTPRDLPISPVSK